MQFEQKTLSEIQWNPFDMIGKQWYLLTAGGLSDYNTMTASWGFMGEMWGKPSFLCGVRTNRHTLPFMEQNDCFSVSFFEESQRAALQFCGTHSGRDYDKAKETGLTPNFEYAAPTFAEGNLVFICKKIHAQAIDPACFLDADIEKNYPQKDYHTMYIGEILEAYVAE